MFLVPKRSIPSHMDKFMYLFSAPVVWSTMAETLSLFLIPSAPGTQHTGVVAETIVSSLLLHPDALQSARPTVDANVSAESPTVFLSYTCHNK